MAEVRASSEEELGQLMFVSNPAFAVGRDEHFETKVSELLWELFYTVDSLSRARGLRPKPRARLLVRVVGIDEELKKPDMIPYRTQMEAQKASKSMVARWYADKDLKELTRDAELVSQDVQELADGKWLDERDSPAKETLKRLQDRLAGLQTRVNKLSTLDEHHKVGSPAAMDIPAVGNDQADTGDAGAEVGKAYLQKRA